MSIHRADCANLEAMRDRPERFVDVTWTGKTDATFLVHIEVEALDRERLLSDVSRVLSDHHLNIIAANVNTTKDRVALLGFNFEMADPSHLGAVLNSVRRIDGVYDVQRIGDSRRPPGTPSRPSSGPFSRSTTPRSGASASSAGPRPRRRTRTSWPSAWRRAGRRSWPTATWSPARSIPPTRSSASGSGPSSSSPTTFRTSPRTRDAGTGRSSPRATTGSPSTRPRPASRTISRPCWSGPGGRRRRGARRSARPSPGG